MSGTADVNTRTGHDVVTDVVGVVGVVLAGGQSRRMGRDKALLRLDDGRTLLERTVRVLRTMGLDDVLLSVSSPERALALRTTVPAVAALPIVADDTPGRGPLGGLAAALRARPGHAVLLVACDLPHLDSHALRLVVDAYPSPPLALRGTPPLLPVRGRGEQDARHPSPPSTERTPVGSGNPPLLPTPGGGPAERPVNISDHASPRASFVPHPTAVGPSFAMRPQSQAQGLGVRAVDVVLPRIGGYAQPLHAVYGPACLPHVLRLLDAGRLAMSGLLTAPELCVAALPEDYFVARGVAPSCFANVNTPDDLAALALEAPVGG